MSYYFYMTVDLGGPEPHIVQSELNYTYNVYQMFRTSLDLTGGINDLRGKTGVECMPFLRRAIADMEDNQEKYREMNPEGDWGSYEGAGAVLRKLLLWCVETPNAIMEIC